MARRKDGGLQSRQEGPPVPELPEVETVVRELRPHLVGRRVTGVRRGRRKLRRPWQAEWDGLLVGRTVSAVGRQGKWIVVALADGRRLVVHLGMTGQLTVADAAAPRQDHTHLVLALDDGRELRFRDVRRFGCALLFATDIELGTFFGALWVGPEPFNLNARYWRERLARTRRCLKAVLLDQGVVAGVGNIYADESLFAAKLHPGRAANTLTPREASRLRKAVAAVLTAAIDKRGSTIRDYVGGLGQAGGFQDEFCVYGRTGEACPRCRTPVERLRLAGRSSHYCPSCQPTSPASANGPPGETRRLARSS
jgi:formamidopyrimidine-DNA glycosylase